MSASQWDTTADRAMLINIAYRMLGSVADAEDAVQDTYVRWFRLTAAQRAEIRRPTAWRVRAVTHICLDVLGSARRRREEYVGPWIPEPLPCHRASTWADPADSVTMDESVTLAMLVVLESMTPAERVAFVLHDVFGYPFREVGTILGRSPAACRQLATSARRRLPQARANTLHRHAHATATVGLRHALHRGDVATLVQLLHPQVQVTNDGGGRVRAALRPITGRDNVIRYLMGVRAHHHPAEVLFTDVNGTPGVRIRRDGRTTAVMAIELHDTLVTSIWIVRNTDKLRYWNPPCQSVATCGGS